MFQNVHSIAMYASDLHAALETYQGLGLELIWSDMQTAPDGVTFCRLGLRYPKGEVEMILHNNPQRQFTETTVAVPDVKEAYRQLSKNPYYLWLELPHDTPQGCRAFLRAPDGNVFALLSPPYHTTPKGCRPSSALSV